MAETLRSFPDLHVFIMEEMQSDARMDGGDVLFTGGETVKFTKLTFY